MEGVFIYSTTTTSDVKKATDFSSPSSDPLAITPDNSQPNDSAFLPNGNVLIAVIGSTQIEASVYNSNLNSVASTILLSDTSNSISVTSYPAGGDGYFVMAVEDSNKIVIRIFD